MTSLCVAEHAWVYLNAIIDPLTREIVGWELSVRWRATEAIAVIQTAVRDQGIGPGLTLGTDNGSALTARRLGLRSPGSACALRARHRSPSRRLRRPGAKRYRVMVPRSEATLRLAQRVREPSTKPAGVITAYSLRGRARPVFWLPRTRSTVRGPRSGSDRLPY
jgi:transposase InsO family protein